MTEAPLHSVWRCAEILAMKSLVQAGHRGRVSVPLEKRSFLSSGVMQIKGGYSDV